MKTETSWLQTLAGNVLYVEDEPLIAMETEDLLRDLGIERLAVAHNFARAEQLIDSNEFTLAIMDMNLNGTLSTPLVDSLSARGVPVLVTSGYNTGENFAASKFVIAVQKPFTEAAIVDGLERLAAATL
ncbi:response regulator [Rhizobiaceae bacterium]|nr:response regulator [Rhizobiaceae bacterium]